MQNVNFPHFKIIRFINDPKDGIAKSRASTGELVINMHYWKKLKSEHKVFVLCHEEGHIKFNTRDEMEADDWASKKYFSLGLPISESVQALSSHLSKTNPVHIARAWLQFNRALQYDYIHNKNNAAFRKSYETAESIKQKLLQNKF